MKAFKKIIAVLLTATLILSLSPAVFACDIKVERDCPHIFIHGFAAKTIYEDPSDPDSKTVFPPETDVIVKSVVKCIPALTLYTVNKNGKMLADAVVPALLDIFEPAFLDNNGDIPEGNTSGVRFDIPDESEITPDCELDFEYDWRLDPIETAAKLNDFIEYVCDVSGCERVTLMAHSFGGVIALSYMTLYGTQRLKGVVMNSTAVYGETYTGELMTGDIKLSMDAVRSYMRFILNESELKELVDRIFGELDKAGLSDFVEKFGNEIIEKSGDEIMKKVITPLFIHWPSVWAMNPDEYLEASYKFIFGEMISQDTDCSGLKAKIESYNTLVRADKTQTLINAEKSIKLGVFARYGFSTIPVTSSWSNMSDGVIDTKYASFGATTSKSNDTLSEEYLKNADPKYISPDKTIDASTCLFPEKTWFFKDYGHGDADFIPELTMAILYSENEVTVDTYKKYPRFITFVNGDFIPDKGFESNAPKIVKLFFKLLKLFTNAVKGIFGR